MQMRVELENQRLREENLWRELRHFSHVSAREVVWENQTLLNFSSNDYLGFSNHPQVIAAAQKALSDLGSGARASRLICGNLAIHSELEKKLAALKNCEAALLFPSGFMANLGAIASLLRDGDAVIMDPRNHASLWDAARLSRARVFTYEHKSVADLERIFKRTKNYQNRLVVTDSVFSMDGDVAPVADLAKLCAENKAWLLIDDAHATGVLGETGRGACEHFRMATPPDVVIGTLSKALGSQGGFVCGKKDFIEFLVNRARSFIYTTALLPAAAATAVQALELLQKEPERLARLRQNSTLLRQELAQLFPEQKSTLLADLTPIVPLIAGSEEKALSWALTLEQNKIFAPAIRPPTVPQDSCRLRFSVTSEHTAQDIERLLGALREVKK